MVRSAVMLCVGALMCGVMFRGAMLCAVMCRVRMMCGLFGLMMVSALVRGLGLVLLLIDLRLSAFDTMLDRAMFFVGDLSVVDGDVKFSRLLVLLGWCRRGVFFRRHNRSCFLWR